MKKAKNNNIHLILVLILVWGLVGTWVYYLRNGHRTSVTTATTLSEVMFDSRYNLIDYMDATTHPMFICWSEDSSFVEYLLEDGYAIQIYDTKVIMLRGYEQNYQIEVTLEDFGYRSHGDTVILQTWRKANCD